MAAKQNPKPQTVAIITADAEFAGRRHRSPRRVKKHGMKVRFLRQKLIRRPPRLTPVMRGKADANESCTAGAYPPDSVGIVRAADEIGLNPKMLAAR